MRLFIQNNNFMVKANCYLQTNEFRITLPLPSNKSVRNLLKINLFNHLPKIVHQTKYSVLQNNRVQIL